MSNLKTNLVLGYFGFLLVFTFLCWGLIAIFDLEYFTGPVVFLYLAGGISPALWAILFVRSRYFSTKQRKIFFKKVVSYRDIGSYWLLIILLYPLITFISVSLSSFILGHVLAFDSKSQILTDPIMYILSFFPVLVGVVGEEIGWRGFAQRYFGENNSFLVSALVIGTIWALWHLPLFFIKGTYQYELGFLNTDFLIYMIELIPLSVILGWIFYKTNKCTLAAIVFHLVMNINPIEDLYALDNIAKIVRLALFLLISIVIVLKDRKRPILHEEHK